MRHLFLLCFSMLEASCCCRGKNETKKCGRYDFEACPVFCLKLYMFFIFFFIFSSAKIKNIELTEDAKQKLLEEKKRQRENMPSQFVPTNVAVNFVQHNRCEYCCCSNQNIYIKGVSYF